MDYIVKILRTLFFNLDKVVYEGIGNVYDLLLKIARTTIFNSETIDGFYTRIYALIGIFMLFKVTLSLINYVVNPDDFVDKEKGIANITKRIIISLVMLVLVPYGFKEAYELQTIILEDNTLLALIFGTPTEQTNEISSTYMLDSAGDKMKFVLMYTFFQPNYNELYDKTGAEELSSCAITYQYDDDGSIKVQDSKYVLNETCFGAISDDKYGSTAFTRLWDNKNDLYQTYAQGVARQNFYLMFKHDIAMIQANESETYLINYMAPLSTAVGVAVLWVLLLFCIDVAVRSVKLGFYELIAPIPILSYIDPKSKDGMFSKWIKQCLTTYASLFIRLIALYVAIFIIFEVSSKGITDVITGEKITDWWVCIFIIVGVLIFAKQLPKILEDALGFKGTGDFTLNPLKKLEEGMFAGKAIKRTGATVAAAGLAGGAAFASNLITRKNPFSAIAGAGSAMGRAAMGGIKGEKFGKNWASSYGGAMKAKQSRADRKSDEVGWGEMMTSKLQQKMGVHTRGEKAESVSKNLQTIQKGYEQYEKTSVGVDAYAKYADKQAKAAAAQGLFEKTRMWEEARDNRIKQISQDGGKVVKSAKDLVDTDFLKYNASTGRMEAKDAEDFSSTISAKGHSEEIEASLSNLGKQLDALAAATNKAGDSVEGYQAIKAKISTDGVKTMKNEALSSQQNVDIVNVHNQDVDKYGAKKDQK